MVSKLVTVSLFVEDIEHEKLVHALIRRVAAEKGFAVKARGFLARGGPGRVPRELKLFQRLTSPIEGELLVLVVDAGMKGWHDTHGELEQLIDKERFPSYVVACPEPCVERWYMADPESLREALGANVSPGKFKCERERYKRMLTTDLRNAGHPVLLGGGEFAEEIVAAMDLTRAAKNEPSLKNFLSDFRTELASRR
jgi:hypothetical protein